jgi:hypothetical protein
MTANYSNKNGLVYPSGTTAARPSSVNNGFIYFNTTVGALQIYQNGSWYVLTNINAPGAPTSVSATNQGTGRAYNNGQMSVSFTPTAETVGFPSTFTVTPSPTTSPATFAGTSSPITVTGLSSSTQYTYTVTSANNTGTSSSSSASSAVTATTVPQAPTISATAGDTVATIAITPGATGGAAISQYSITSSPTTTTQTTSGTSYTFTGLTNGTSYTFTATATNANGTSSASSATSSITPQLGDPGFMFPIRSYVVPSGGSASVTFSSIPSTYKHLQIRILGRGSYAYSNLLDGNINFNSDATVTNYYSHTLKGNGASATSLAEQSPWLKNCFPGANQTASVFGSYVIDILDYANTNKYKTVRYLGGVDVNGSGQINAGSNLWNNTAAISSILLSVDGNWTQYTSIALYGVNA